MRYLKFVLVFLSVGLFFNSVFAKENVDKKNDDGPNKKEAKKQLAAGCAPASAAVDLNINNVRARIMNGGDMWWDLVNSAEYEVPKTDEPPHRTSLFAGALWIGGFDQGGNLRAAAMTYRQNGSDFYPGPLDTTDASVTSQVCNNWDKIWKVNRDDIEDVADGDASSIPQDIQNWPTRGDVSKGQSRYLAPFVDKNNNGIYEPRQGDHPDVPGDQALWFIYNDKGNIHSETQAPAIGLEVQTIAFAFQTNDELNNTTFYRHKVINRSTNRLDSVHFGQWVDPDLGYPYDDYVGCDTSRELGICYNGDNFDEGFDGYGQNPPSVGVDFFEGPTTRNGKTLGMSYFVYYNNDFSSTGNPEEAQHYYNYLTGTWKDGSRITYGGNGKGGSRTFPYMFPGDPTNSDAWSEETAGNTPGDRRFLQSSGPFTLMPGAVNYVTVGVVWAKATTGGNTGSLDLLRIADNRAQQLYNNNFDPLDGPPAPTVRIQELDKKLILSMEETRATENYFEEGVGQETTDTIEYIFQGYKIYQLADAGISADRFDNPDVARQIRQVDVEDKISTLVNQEFNPTVNEEQSVLMVQGNNNGVRHTFEITTDVFASGASKLINNKAYHFAVVPYAAANPNDSVSAQADIQYLESREPIEITAYPHKTEPELNGAITQASYGDQPRLTRIEGKGNGGLTLDLTEETEQRILENGSVANPTYKINGGPANIFVYDPMNVPNANFTFKIHDSTVTNPNNDEVAPSATWSLNNLTEGMGDSIVSEEPLGGNNEQVIGQYGLSVHMNKVIGPSLDTVTENMGLQEATMTFEDDQVAWLTGVADNDRRNSRTLPDPRDWIRSGQVRDDPSSTNYALDDAMVGSEFVDPRQVYEDLLGGIVAPYGLTARSITSDGLPTFGPALQAPYTNGSIEQLNSVDLVFTSNKENWSECVVLEMNPSQPQTQGQALKFDLRDHASWEDPYAIQNGKPQYSGSEKGKSWFPGYAINLETGERLNIMFGEDSWYQGENGADMLWNPTSNVTNTAASSGDFDFFRFGGKHYIYIMGANSTQGGFNIATAYDGGESYHTTLSNNPNVPQMRALFGSAMWVMIPTLADGYQYKSLEEGLIPTKTTVELRVDVPYQTYNPDGSGNAQNNNLPMYSFNTSGLATKTSEAMGKTALDMVRVVPNPYYAYSAYEVSQLDNRVRITNLPQECKISIYTLDGKLVRQFIKDQTASNHQTFLDWNLQNSAGIPIGSGVYLIHVNGYELGQKTIKWFGIRRPLDLDTF